MLSHRRLTTQTRPPATTTTPTPNNSRPQPQQAPRSPSGHRQLYTATFVLVSSAPRVIKEPLAVCKTPTQLCPSNSNTANVALTTQHQSRPSSAPTFDCVASSECIEQNLRPESPSPSSCTTRPPTIRTESQRRSHPDPPLSAPATHTHRHHENQHQTSSAQQRIKPHESQLAARHRRTRRRPVAANVAAQAATIVVVKLEHIQLDLWVFASKPIVR